MLWEIFNPYPQTLFIPLRPTMTENKHKELFEKLLVSFIREEDPMKEMMQWMSNQLMEIEINSLKTQADKGVHSPTRKTYRNG